MWKRNHFFCIVILICRLPKQHSHEYKRNVSSYFFWGFIFFSVFFFWFVNICFFIQFGVLFWLRKESWVYKLRVGPNWNIDAINTYRAANSSVNQITTIISILSSISIACSSYSSIVQKTLKAKHVNTIKNLYMSFVNYDDWNSTKYHHQQIRQYVTTSIVLHENKGDKKENKMNEKSYFINPQQKMKNLFIKYHI